MTHTYVFQFFRSSRSEDIRILENAAFFCTMPRGLGLIYAARSVDQYSDSAINSVLTGSVQNRMNYAEVSNYCSRTHNFLRDRFSTLQFRTLLHELNRIILKREHLGRSI